MSLCPSVVPMYSLIRPLRREASFTMGGTMRATMPVRMVSTSSMATMMLTKRLRSLALYCRKRTSG